jgi:hypothetical protein
MPNTLAPALTCELLHKESLIDDELRGCDTQIHDSFIVKLRRRPREKCLQLQDELECIE